MSDFDEKMMQRLKRLEREVERLQRWEKPVVGVFQNYTLSWTAATTNPSIGNAVVASRYSLIGKICTVVVSIAFGSTTTYGSGGWRFSLPLSAKNTAGINYFGVAHLRNTGISNHERIAQIAPSVSQTDIRLFIQMDDNTNNFNLDATYPFTWGNGDFIGFQITYEVE